MIDPGRTPSAPVTTPVLSLEGITLELGGRTILADTSFTVNQGEFIGVLGPNGAGKTTLMRAVLGLVPAVSGAIRVLGRPVERGNPSIGYMPQTRSALAGRDVAIGMILSLSLGFGLLFRHFLDRKCVV